MSRVEISQKYLMYIWVFLFCHGSSILYELLNLLRFLSPANVWLSYPGFAVGCRWLLLVDVGCWWSLMVVVVRCCPVVALLLPAVELLFLSVLPRRRRVVR